MPLLQAVNLRKTYAGRTVVNGVSFEVEQSEIVGLLGRNGAGKTTSFRMTIGMIDTDDGAAGAGGGGRVFFKGEDVTGLPMYQRAKRGMGYLSQEPSVFQRLTVEQNLLAILETTPMRRGERKRRAEALLAQFGLKHKAKHAARTCSGGERRKLEIARAMVTRPALILLDEPFSGVDPIAVEDLQREIKALADQGIACLITDHNVQQTLRVCDRACIIDDGRKFAEGTPRELINDEMVRRVYLGSLFRGDEFDHDGTHTPGGRGADGAMGANGHGVGAANGVAATLPGAPHKIKFGVSGVNGNGGVHLGGANHGAGNHGNVSGPGLPGHGPTQIPPTKRIAGG